MRGGDGVRGESICNARWDVVKQAVYRRRGEKGVENGDEECLCCGRRGIFSAEDQVT